MVYLSSSKFSLAVLGNLGFALALATYKLILRVRRRRSPRRRLLGASPAAGAPRQPVRSLTPFSAHPSERRSSWAGCATARWSG